MQKIKVPIKRASGKSASMHFINIVYILSVTLISGCAQLTPTLKPVTAYPETATNNITIFRNNSIDLVDFHFWPTIDNNEITGLLPRQHTSLTLNPGDYALGTRCHYPSHFTGHEIDVFITGNKPRYFLITLAFHSCTEIVEIEKTEAEERFKESTRIKTGHISNCEGESVRFSEAEEIRCR